MMEMAKRLPAALPPLKLGFGQGRAPAITVGRPSTALSHDIASFLRKLSQCLWLPSHTARPRRVAFRAL